MHLLELASYSEGLSKMIADGVMPQKALGVVARFCHHSKNIAFHADLSGALLGKVDGQQTDALATCLNAHVLPPFYRAILLAGEQSGHVPEAFATGAYYLNHTAVITNLIRKCLWCVVLALLIAVGVTLFVDHAIAFKTIMVSMTLIVTLFSHRFRRLFDVVIAYTPFISSYVLQLTLMEFLLCMQLMYDSQQSAKCMYQSSLDAIGNVYFKSKMAKGIPVLNRRESFTQAFGATGLVPIEMLMAIETHETVGKLPSCFEVQNQKLKRMIEAKLEPVKALVVVIFINMALVIPAGKILPLFFNIPFLYYGLAAISAATIYGSLRYAIINYKAKLEKQLPLHL